MALKILSYPQNKNAQKALIAAQFAGVDIEEPPFEWGVTNKTDEFKKLTVIGKVPVLVSPKGTLFESNAIARYVARLSAESGLFGADEWETGKVDQWIDFACNELGAHLMPWATGVCGFGPYTQVEVDKYKGEANRGLAALEEALTSGSTKLRLVGEQITLADIIVFCELLVPWQCLLAPDFMEPYPMVVKYMLDLSKLKEFHAVVGDIEQAPSVPTKPLAPEDNPFMKKAKEGKELEERQDKAKKARTGE